MSKWLSKIPFLTTALIVGGCTSKTTDDLSPLNLPAADDSFVLGAAGAPQPLFGPDDAPTFAAGYRALAEAGFNRFVPVFLTSEAGEGTAHVPYYLPPLPELGIARAQSCVGAAGAWDLPAGLSIDFPMYLLTLDQAVDQPLDQALTRQRLQALSSQCLANNAAPLATAYLQDEPANNYVASLHDTSPNTFDLGNVAALATLSREEFAIPTLMIEAPLPFVVEQSGASAAQIEQYVPPFWQAVDQLAPHADSYGFDVYPIGLTDDLRVLSQYIEFGKLRAEGATPVMVLQGSGYADTGIAEGEAGRRPTRAETRAMAFLAAIHGARGLYWYGQSAINLGDGPLWHDILEVVADLRKASGALSSPLVSAPTSANDEVAVRKTQSDDTTWVFIANTRPEAAVFEMQLSAEPAVVFDGLSGEVIHAAATGSFTLQLTPYDARFLAVRTQ